MISAVQQIVNYAHLFFDVVGVSKAPSSDNLLILGLESRPKRDLDEFGRVDGNFQKYGFEKHVGPRLESLVDYIHEKGFSATPVGRYGYPRKGEVNLKTEAILAGLGWRGKNTVVLHPEYGPRLRFMAVSTDAPLEPSISTATNEEESPACSACSICIDTCPVKALKPYRMPDTSLCLSNIAIMDSERERLIPCDICLHLCPAAKHK